MQELRLRIAVTTSPNFSWTVLQVHLKLGSNVPLSAKRNLFCKICWQHCVAVTLRAHWPLRAHREIVYFKEAFEF